MAAYPKEFYPPVEETDALATAKKKAEAKGVQNPFIYTPVGKWFVPC